MEYPQIEIRTVEDFFKVAPEKRAHCVRDFELWLAQHEWASSIEGLRVTASRDTFVWIDDGKHEVSLKINGLDVEELQRPEPQPTIMSPQEVADAVIERFFERFNLEKLKAKQ